MSRLSREIHVLVQIKNERIKRSVQHTHIRDKNLSDEKLLNLEIDDMINDEETLNFIDSLDSNLSDEEALEVQERIMNLSEDKFLIDEETFAYIDTINQGIDVQQLIDSEEILSTHDAEALVAPIVVKGMIAATTALLRKFGILHKEWSSVVLIQKKCMIL